MTMGSLDSGTTNNAAAERIDSSVCVSDISVMQCDDMTTQLNDMNRILPSSCLSCTASKLKKNRKNKKA